VVLVPGFRGGRDGWSALQGELTRTGFPVVHTAPHDPETMDVADIAGRLVDTCRDARRSTGAERVHLVGYSLGGVVLRYAVHRLGLADEVGAALTVAAPHRGVPVAWLARGRVAADLRPGSRLLTELARSAAPDDVRWTAYWSDTDLVVPPSSARLAGVLPRADDVLVRGQGHLGVVRAPALVTDVVQRLCQAEPVLAPAALLQAA
jgi:pimeloyl-ACP methyl ester carboxylesterase